MFQDLKIRTFFAVGSGICTLQIMVLSGMLAAVFYYANEGARLKQEHLRIISTTDELRQSVDDLTRFARLYAMSGDKTYVENYRRVLAIRNGAAPRPQDYKNIYWDLSPAARQKHHPLQAPESLAARLDLPSLTAWEREQLRLGQTNANKLVHMEKAVFAALGSAPPPPPTALFSKEYQRLRHHVMLPLDRLRQSLQERYLSEEKRAQKMTDNILVAFTLVMILFLLTSLLMLGYGRKKLLTPINYLSRVIHNIQRGRPFVKRIFYKDEIGLLMRRFYSMKERMDQSYQNLEVMSFQDALTSLHNRHYFYRAAETAGKTARRNQQIICLLICDIDHFKSVNDTYGHLLGDEALRHVAAIISGSVRESDICARAGGDEFIVLLQNTMIGNATQIAEKIRAKVAASPCVTAQIKLNLTLSIGTAQVDDGGNIDQAMDLADKALYQAKNNGRNQVCEADPPSQPTPDSGS
ncbi:MAG: GGDEF domain-containing protein [Gammaproteobacteria bacterium]